MPKMDGFKLVKAIKNNSQFSDTPVVAVSGRTNVSTETYTEAGFAGNMIKPYQPSALLLKIGAILHLDLKKDETLIKKKPTNFNYTLDEILLFAGEDQDALNTILTAFINSTTINLQEIRSAMDQNDSEKAANIAHRMLPMFKQLKTRRIIRKLERIEEKEIEEKDISLLFKEIEIFLKDLQKEIKV